MTLMRHQCNGKTLFWYSGNGTLARYVKLRVTHAPGILGMFPRHRLQRKPLVNDPGMHHGTCLTHVPWCMSESLTRSGEENVPGIPGACTTCNFTYLARGPRQLCCNGCWRPCGQAWLIHDANCAPIYDVFYSLSDDQTPHLWISRNLEATGFTFTIVRQQYNSGMLFIFGICFVVGVV